MTKRLDWASVRDDVSRYYNEGMPLLAVQGKLLQERSFKASIRAYRLKVKEWEIKRSGTTKRHNVGDTMKHSDQPDFYGDTGLQAVSTHHYAIDDFQPSAGSTSNATVQHHVSTSLQDEQTWTDGNCDATPELPLQYMQYQFQHANKFDETLRRIHEAPSSSTYMELLRKNDLYSDASTLVHHVAAKGRTVNILKEILQFFTNHRYPFNIPDQNGSNPLHVAIQHDCTENAIALLDHAADILVADARGDLPLHMAIIRGNGRLVEELRSRDPNTVKTPAQSPSEEPGKVALDLIVDQLMSENAILGTPVCTSSTKRMLLAIVDSSTSTIEDEVYLKQHARDSWYSLRQVVSAIDKIVTFSQDYWLRKLRDQIMDVLKNEKHLHSMMMADFRGDLAHSIISMQLSPSNSMY